MSIPPVLQIDFWTLNGLYWLDRPVRHLRPSPPFASLAILLLSQTIWLSRNCIELAAIGSRYRGQFRAWWSEVQRTGSNEAVSIQRKLRHVEGGGREKCDNRLCDDGVGSSNKREKRYM